MDLNLSYPLSDTEKILLAVLEKLDDLVDAVRAPGPDNPEPEDRSALKNEIRVLKAELEKEKARADGEYARGWAAGYTAKPYTGPYTIPTTYPYVYPYKPTWVSTPGTYTVNSAGVTTKAP